jgi:hypothetical protein
MHRIANLVRIIGLLSLAVALSGCSAIKLGYNTLPQVGAWWIDGYIDLADEQEQRLRDDIGRLHQWHRRQELPKISALLQQAERMVAGEFTAQEACELVPEIRARLLAVGEQAEPAAATLALALVPAQLAHLERKYQKNNRDYRKDWIDLPPDELQDKRFKQILDRTEMVYGRLDDPQREVLRSQMARTVFDPQTNLQERQRRQQDILQTLRGIAGRPTAPGEARTLVRRLLERGLQSPDRRYHAYQETLLQETCRNLAAVHQSTTPQQRQNAVRRLRAYQRDLAELAAEP